MAGLSGCSASHFSTLPSLPAGMRAVVAARTDPGAMSFAAPSIRNAQASTSEVFSSRSPRKVAARVIQRAFT